MILWSVSFKRQIARNNLAQTSIVLLAPYNTNFFFPWLKIHSNIVNSKDFYFIQKKNSLFTILISLTHYVIDKLWGFIKDILRLLTRASLSITLKKWSIPKQVWPFCIIYLSRRPHHPNRIHLPDSRTLEYSISG